MNPLTLFASILLDLFRGLKAEIQCFCYSSTYFRDELVPLRKATSAHLEKTFPENNFGIPRTFVRDNGTQFTSRSFTEGSVCFDRQITRD